MTQIYRVTSVALETETFSCNFEAEINAHVGSRCCE